MICKVAVSVGVAKTPLGYKTYILGRCATLNQQAKLKTFISIILFILIWFFVYAFLHEAGHALVGMAYGGTIKNFVFWNFNAHVVIAGANYSQFGEPLMNAAGILFPILIFVIAIGFYNSKVKFAGYHLCYFAATLSLVFGAFAGWVIIPFRSLFTLSLSGEDMVRFVDNTGFHPVLVSLMGLFLIGSFALFAHKRGIFVGAWSAFNSLNGKEVSLKTTKIKWGIVSVGSLIVAIVIFVIAFFVPYEPPHIFNVSASVTDVRIENNVKHTFTANEARRYNFNIAIQQGFMTGYILKDSEGERQGWGTFTGDVTSSLSFELSEGTYTMQFIFLPDFGAVTDFLIYVGVYDFVEPLYMQNFRDVFENYNDDFSVTYSLRIR